MKASIRALCCAAAFAVPHAGEAAAPLETDTMVGLMVKANPKLLERKAVESFAKFVWCHEYGAVRNEFDREDYLTSLADRMKGLGASSLGRIEGLTRRFPFFEYDFKTETLQIDRGQYQWAQTAPVGSLLSQENRPCWANLGNMFSFTPTVEALPDWNAIPHRISIPKDQARTLFEHGRPSAELTFSIKVENYTVEPMGSPKYIFRGPTTEWELVIYDGNGAEARRYASGSRTAQPPSTSPPTTRATESLAGSSRITTAGINVREEPSLAGTLLGTLGTNSVFDIEESSPDGQWSRINAPPVLRGWANTAVILRSSTPNGATTGVPATTAALRAPKPDSEGLKQKMLFLVTGLDGPPYRDVEEYHNALGTHIKTVTHTYEPTFESPCVVKFKYTNNTKDHTANKSALGNSTSLRRFDFSKMTRISARYTEQPEEGLWWAFAGGPSNPRMRKPRFVTLVDYFGADASCLLKDDGTPSHCSKDEQSNGNFPYPNPAKRPKHFQDAFNAVKAACR